eukprot:scaffold193563_cov29-Tisochrysis_lutea.AAC.1
MTLSLSRDTRRGNGSIRENGWSCVGWLLKHSMSCRTEDMLRVRVRIVDLVRHLEPAVNKVAALCLVLPIDDG